VIHGNVRRTTGSPDSSMLFVEFAPLREVGTLPCQKEKENNGDDNSDEMFCSLKTFSCVQCAGAPKEKRNPQTSTGCICLNAKKKKKKKGKIKKNKWGK
jgi:hypothetical protein